MNIHIEIPIWLIYSLIYSIYFLVISLLWVGSIRAICYITSKTLGLWIWKAWLGLYFKGGNDYSNYAISCLLNDIYEKTGVEYIPKNNEDENDSVMNTL